MVPRPRRVKPGETVEIARKRVRNETSNSIQVAVATDGTVRVTDCCLEEQGL